MSIDDTSYFDSSNESYQDDYQTTEPTIEQLSGVIQSLQSKLSSLEANPLAGLGYQPIQQPSSQYDPTSLKEAQEFLKAQGVMTKDSYTEMVASETREEAAINNGFQNSQHLAANFWGEYYSANNPQTKAELESLLNLYESGSRVNIQKAVQGFKSFSERKQQNSQPLQSQTFGRVPQQQNTQSQSAGGWPFGKTGGAQEYNSWKRTADPQMVRQLEQKWMSGQIPDPF